MRSHPGSRGRMLAGITALLILFPVGVARADSRFVQVETQFARPSPDRAVLYLVREQFVRNRPLPHENLYLDGRPLGLLPQRAYLIAELGPGWHRVSGVPSCPDLRIRCRAGRVHLARLREYVDPNDQLIVNWLLDDPERVRELVEQARLALVRVTDKGVHYLSQRSAAREAAGPVAAADTTDLTEIDGMLGEDPLDPVNLERDFLNFTGRLVLAPDALQFRSKRLTKDIPWTRVVRVRFGSTRFTGTQPWLEIRYGGPQGLAVLSLADSRASSAVETYNRLFALVTERWHELRKENSKASSDSLGDE